MRLERIVVGMDFSPGSVSTANWLGETLAPAATLVLAHAVEPPARPAFPVAETLPSDVLATAARAEAREQLDQILPAIHGRTLKTEIRVGRAHRVIMDVATEIDADLIAVGPHRNYAHTSMLLGPTADVLIRSSRVPVVIGPRTPTSDRRHIVAGVTDSSAMPQVFAYADYLASTLGGGLTLVNVLETSAYSHMASLAAAHAHGDDERARDEVEAELRSQVTRWLWQAAAAGADPTRIDVRVEHGQAAEVLVEVARRERAALIVLGGHTPARHLPAVLGRTVRHVVYAAPCGIVVVPA